MPELPEVETVCRGLRAAKLHGPIQSVWRSRSPLRVGRDWQRSDEGCRKLKGLVPTGVERRGKYIIWLLTTDARDQDYGFVIHLGMSGRCGVSNSADELVTHTHLRVAFADGRELRFVDPRRFGGLRFGPRSWLAQSWPPLAGLGIEPLAGEFDGTYLQTAYGKSTRIIRDALLDQRGVAGIGNIYAVEACFQSGIHPMRPANSLRTPEWRALASALVDVLQRGIRNGGTTLAHFRDVTGEVGRNQDDLRIYGRAQQPCPHCSHSIDAFNHGGRTGYFCARCQPLPGRRPPR